MRFRQVSIEGNNRLYLAGPAGWQHHHPIPASNNAGGELPGIPAKVERRPNHVLDGETHVFPEVQIDRYRFEKMQQRTAPIPRGSLTDGYDIVAFERTDRNEVDIMEMEILCELTKIGANSGEDLLAIIDE